MELASRVIEGSQPGPRLLITGGVHGDEFEPMAAARRLARVVKPERLRGRLTVVPVVNEPAFRRGSRVADDGKDLARTCPGNDDGTITERVAAALTRRIRDSDYYIDLHTGGTRLQVWPLVGYMLHPDAQVLAAQRRMAHAFGLPFVWGTDWRLDGRSLSVARDARVPALYAEYLGGGGCSPDGVSAYVDGCLRVMRELGMLDDAPPLDPRLRRLVVEDDRPGSGHMQINLPAPDEGFFEPRVGLGEWVRRGQLVGLVCDPVGDRRYEILAPHDGVVVVLHTFARVDLGECLGVILDRSEGR